MSHRSPRENGRNTPSLRLAIVLLTGAAARVVYLISFLASPLYQYYRNDHLYYREWALRIAQGEWIGRTPFEQGPLYAYLLGSLYRLLQPRDAFVLGVQLLAGLCTVALIFWCTRRVGGDRAALPAGLIAALYGPYVFYECMIMKTFLEPLLVLAALAAGLRALEANRTRWYATAGAALGLACLVREAHVVLFVPLLLATSFPGSGSPQPLLRRLRNSGAILLACGVTLAPSILHNWVVAREPVAVSSAGGQNFYIAFGPYATGYYVLPPFATSLASQEHEDFREEAFLRTGRRMSRGESSRYWLGETLRWIRTAPGRTLALVGKKAAILLNDTELPDSEDFTATGSFIPFVHFLPTFGWIAGPGLLGFLLLCRSRGAPRLTAGFAAMLVVEVLLTFNLGRYRAAFAGVWILCSGIGIAWLAEGFSQWSHASVRWRIIGAAAAALLTALAFRDPPFRSASRLQAIHELSRRQAQQAVPHRRKIPELRKALAARPNDPVLLYELGVAFDGIGSISEAVQAYEAALRGNKELVAPRSRLITVYNRRGETRRAVEHARALVGLHPRDAGAWATLGSLLARQAEASSAADTPGLLSQATATLNRAAALDPQNVESHYWLARMHVLAGQDKNALIELETARRISGTLVRPRDFQMADHLARLIRGRQERRDEIP